MDICVVVVAVAVVVLPLRVTRALVSRRLLLVCGLFVGVFAAGVALTPTMVSNNTHIHTHRTTHTEHTNTDTAA